MKRYLFTGILCCILMFQGFSQVFEWTRSAGGQSNDISNEICRDKDGNLYIAGYFQDSAFFQSSVLVTNPYSYLNHNGFLAKYDPEGNLIWLRQMSGPDPNECKAVTCDSTGIYIAGYYITSILFHGTTDTIHMGSAGSTDGFIAKYDFEGNVLWSRRCAHPNNGSTWDVHAGNNGTVAITGRFMNTIHIEGDSNLITLHAHNDNAPGMFVAKYTAEGELLWANAFSGECPYPCGGGSGPYNDISGSEITSDKNGNIIISGDFAGTIQFGTDSISTSSMHDIFLVKFDPEGIIQWVRQEGLAYDFAEDILCDTAGNIYLTGAYYYDMFLTKFDPSGNVVWFKRGNNIYISGGGVGISPSGNIVITGTFKGTMNLTGSGFTLSSTYRDAYIYEITPSGDVLWAAKTDNQGLGSVAGLGIVADEANNIYVTGRFEEYVLFGDSIHYGNDHQIFLTKVKQADISTGVSSLRPSNSLRIFPNPGDGVFCLEYTCGKPERIWLEIRNIQGQLIYSCSESIPCSGFKKTLDLSVQPKGIYFLELIGDEKRSVRKIVLN